MPRSRVLSFMSQWGSPRSPTTDGTSTPNSALSPQSDTPSKKSRPFSFAALSTQKSEPQSRDVQPSPTTAVSRARGDSRVGNRPESMIQPHQPMQTEVTNDTPPELQPIFTYLNSHSNKLYQEGYFLKLHDLDSKGRPSADRTWMECFAQLVGTVLSLWDAAALDAAGEDGEVVPTFINLSDASIKMIESLPMNGAQGGNLQNVLSVSTAANNRYLLHFNSLNSLTQWTAAIRLAMFEHSTLHEAYTGSLIAGKGRYLNNIKAIMDRSKFSHEDWARVRFGAGTSWKRYWCVVSPPDEKEFAKAQKSFKKTTAYERVRLPKGDIKFYDTRKVTKKTKPVATITDAFAAYAIYPQSKPLIDQSTLVKLEGLLTIHTSPPTTTEGFVFVMPEVHAAVSGFEMMLQWLFRVYDTFGLYGRPNKLVADTLDQRGLMFAMPKNRRYGYLDTLDVSALIHSKGSQAWSERQWRREMKKLTSDRMATYSEASPRNSGQGKRRSMAANHRMSLPPLKDGVRFEEGGPTQSTPAFRSESPITSPASDGPNFLSPKRTDSAPPTAQSSPHKRSVSEAVGYRKFMAERSRTSFGPGSMNEDSAPPSPSKYQASPIDAGGLQYTHSNDSDYNRDSYVAAQDRPALPPPEPVRAPPSFTHSPNSRPANRPYTASDVRQAHSEIDPATLHQMQDAARPSTSPQDEWNGDSIPLHPSVVNSSSENVGYAPRRSSERSRGTNGNEPRQRLSMIPGSPYQPEETNNHNNNKDPYFSPTPRGIDGVMAERPRSGHSTNDGSRNGSPARGSPSRGINRKPLPSKLSTSVADRKRSELDGNLSPESPVSHGSFTGAVLDSSHLEHILNHPVSDRNNTMDSHASSATPDYASTASGVSRRQKESFDKPRTGKLKTVGDPDYLSANQSTDRNEQVNIDFGPTFAYRPNPRLETSSPNRHDRSRSRSIDRLRSGPRERPNANSARTPDETKRHSYFSERSTPNANSPGNRNSIAWQPAGNAPSPGAQRDSALLTPDQWVQHRAALANQPQLPPPRRGLVQTGHGRNASTQSASPLRNTLTKTPPPLSRTPSGDWTNMASRNTPPSRPGSRGSGMLLNQQTPSMQAPNLTAREQMHVARATNTPMISYTSNSQKKEQEQYAPGLFGALASRDREKENHAASNRNSILVQQAISARQQQLEMEAEAQARAHYQQQMQQQAQQFQQQMSYQQQQMLMQSPPTPNYRLSQSPMAGNQGYPPQWQPQQQFAGQQQGYGGMGAPQGHQSRGSFSNAPPGGPRPPQWGGHAQQQGQPQQIVAQQPGGAQQYTQQQRRA